MNWHLELEVVLLLLAAQVFTQDRNIKSCKDGFYFDNTQCQPCSSNCTSCLSMSSCGSCKEGLYGETCSLACPSNCYHNTCNKTTGFCDSCAQGFFVNNNRACERCPQNCKVCDQNCTCRSEQCNGSDGVCTSGCKDGFWNKTCELACSDGCLKNVCHMITGACLEGCLEDFAGTSCIKIQQDEGKRRKSSPEISESFPVIIGFVVIMCFSTMCCLFYKTNNWKKIKDFCTQRIMYKKLEPNNENYI